jgi:hypothetical protein
MRTCMSGAGMPLPSCMKRMVTSPSGLNWNMRALFTTDSTSCSVPLQSGQRHTTAKQKCTDGQLWQATQAATGNWGWKRDLSCETAVAAPCTNSASDPLACCSWYSCC